MWSQRLRGLIAFSSPVRIQLVGQDLPESWTNIKRDAGPDLRGHTPLRTMGAWC